MQAVTIRGTRYTSIEQLREVMDGFALLSRQRDLSADEQAHYQEAADAWGDAMDAHRTERAARLRELARRPGNREAGATFRSSRRDRATEEDAPVIGAPSEVLRDAMETLDRHVQRDSLTSEAAESVEEVLNRDAQFGIDARYIAAVGNEAYERAFSKMLRYQSLAVLRMSSEEQQAVQRVSEAESMRALVEGTGSAGGFAIPITIDPTVTLSSNGALNPIRELATVRPMSTRELRLVTSDGVTAAYAAEATEATDNSPVLAQPTLVAQKAHCFVPFSFELGDDWSAIRDELAKLISDAKDVLEATKFLSGAGSGSSEPVGILSVGTTGSLTTTQRVLTAGTATFAIADVYALKQAVPARFIPQATATLSPTTEDTVYRMVGPGNTTEPVLINENRDRLLGKPYRQWSTMFGSGTTPATGSKLAVMGDFKTGFVIGDRLGMSFEVIPHLFGASNRFPTGQRGAYAYWRNDSRCAVPNALRYLEAK